LEPVLADPRTINRWTLEFESVEIVVRLMFDAVTVFPIKVNHPKLICIHGVLRSLHNRRCQCLNLSRKAPSAIFRE
jgi:hypothetical protein